MPSILCGNCRQHHSSVADVRACHEATQEGHADQQAEMRYERWLEDGGAHADIIQAEHIADLDREHTYAAATSTPEPFKATPLPEVPAGRYALKDTDPLASNKVHFYKVDRPTEGRWAGWVFLAVLASDEKHPIKHRDTKRQILSRIAEDIQGSMLLYGTEIGACGHCGRTLTNDESRARGIGPVCLAKMGW